MAGWDDVPDASAKPAAAAKGWDAVPDVKAPALDFQPTDYGFKAAKGEAPTGGPATIREDGAINFPGQSNWLFYDPKSKQYAPAPSEPWDKKGFLSRNLGADAAMESGRNFGIGTERAVNAGLALGQRAIPSSWQPADQAQTDQATQMTNAQRIAAINATQRESAKKYQDIGQAAPAMAVAGLAPVAGATFIARALPAAATFGTATGVTTEGDIGDRAKAAGLGAAGAMAGQGIIEKGVPLVGKGIGAITNKLSKWGKTPAVQELLDSLGSNFGGKPVGEAAQDAAWKQYNGAWDEFKAAIAPVDEASGGVGMDYSGPIAKLKDILGVGKKVSPAPMEPESKAYLKELLANLEEAASGGGVDSSASGAIDLIKQLGAAQRRLAVRHGETESRVMLNDVRDSILKAMDDSHPELAGQYASAREIFKTKVAPLFDKSEGGQFLTQLRDTPKPTDWLASRNQGSLARMKSDEVGIIAKGSSPEPILYSILEAAQKQANGNPGSFLTSIQKAIPAVEKMATDGTIAPEMLTAFQGLANVSKSAKFTGWLANMGVTAVGTAIGGPMAGAGAATASLGLHLKPAYSAPGIIWSVMQNPATRKLLAFAGKLPAGSPELELIAKEISAKAGQAAASGLPKNITPLRPQLSPAAGEPDPTVAKN